MLTVARLQAVGGAGLVKISPREQSSSPLPDHIFVAIHDLATELPQGRTLPPIHLMHCEFSSYYWVINGFISYRLPVQKWDLLSNFVAQYVM